MQQYSLAVIPTAPAAFYEVDEMIERHLRKKIVHGHDLYGHAESAASLTLCLTEQHSSQEIRRKHSFLYQHCYCFRRQHQQIRFPVALQGLKMTQNNFYDGSDKNSQEAPGRARFFRQSLSRDGTFTGLLSFLLNVPERLRERHLSVA